MLSRFVASVSLQFLAHLQSLDGTQSMQMETTSIDLIRWSFARVQAHSVHSDASEWQSRRQRKTRNRESKLVEVLEAVAMTYVMNVCAIVEPGVDEAASIRFLRMF